jgi:NADPH-dependent 2,4-dienoyl-CoA reductase/sulfur reductase-like enzyme
VGVRLLVIGGSDAGIAAALRARELDSGVEATVLVADAFPSFSICGLPYYLFGDVPLRR